jgi:hypothetical protein
MVSFLPEGDVMPETVLQDLHKGHIYGKDHELIGVPCLFEGKPALPYGCFMADDNQVPAGDDGVRLVILYYDSDSPVEGKDVWVKTLAGVQPTDPKLIALNPRDRRYRLVSHMLLDWLASNRCGTYRCHERHKAVA